MPPEQPVQHAVLIPTLPRRLYPWLIFAVLAVLMALAWSAVQRWLADYERYAEAAARLARTLVRARPPAAVFPCVVLAAPPRRLFGFELNSRPPPAAA